MGIKIWAYVGLATLLLAGVRWAHSSVYDSGWNAAVVMQSQAIRKAENAAVVKARQEWEHTTSIAETQIVVEERIVEVVRVIEKEIPKIVERIVEITPECSDLGDDFAGLLNAQVRSGSSGSNDSSDSAADSH